MIAPLVIRNGMSWRWSRRCAVTERISPGAVTVAATFDEVGLSRQLPRSAVTIHRCSTELSVIEGGLSSRAPSLGPGGGITAVVVEGGDFCAVGDSDDREPATGEDEGDTGVDCGAGETGRGVELDLIGPAGVNTDGDC